MGLARKYTNLLRTIQIIHVLKNGTVSIFHDKVAERIHTMRLKPIIDDYA